MKKSVLFLAMVLCLLMLVGCSEAYKASFAAREMTVTEGDTFTPDVVVRPKRFEYKLFTANNTILTVQGTEATALKAGVTTLTLVSGKKHDEMTVYVLPKNDLPQDGTIFYDSSFISFSVINFQTAQLEQPVIRTLTLAAGTDITESFPILNGYTLIWYLDPDGREPVTGKVRCPAGNVTYYAVAKAENNGFLTREGKVSGLIYPNLVHSYLALPESYNGTEITGVADYAFYGDTTIETVVIPKNYTTIGKFAFAGCTSLKTVRVAEGSCLTEIGAFAFGPTYTEPEPKEEEADAEDDELLAYLDSILNSLGIMQAATPKEEEPEIVINEDYCSALTEMNLPSSLKTIDSYAFYNCSSLGFSLPGGTETIGYGAFRGSNIVSADLSGVKTIEAYAFYDCKALTTVTGAKDVVSCGGYAFYGSKLYEEQVAKRSVVYADTMIVGSYVRLDRVNVRRGTTLIADYAFNNKSQSILTVFFDGSKPLIGWQSFYVTGYQSGNVGLPEYTTDLFLVVEEEDIGDYKNEYPALDRAFCSSIVVDVTDKDTVNFGKHSLLKMPEGYYVYDRFTVGKTREGLFFSPYEIDLSLLENGQKIKRINSYAFSEIAHLQTLRLAGVSTIADCAVSACKNLSLIDLSCVPQGATTTLTTSNAIQFSDLSSACVVLVTKASYGTFKTIWAERTTASSRLRYEQSVQLFRGEELLSTAVLYVPCSVELLPETGVSAWYIDAECTKECLVVSTDITKLYAKSE